MEGYCNTEIVKGCVIYLKTLAYPGVAPKKLRSVGYVNHFALFAVLTSSSITCFSPSQVHTLPYFFLNKNDAKNRDSELFF